MTEARPAAVRRCPTWCSEHYAPNENDDADLGHIHEGLESTQILSVWGNMPLTASLTRADTLDGEPRSYCIELRAEKESLTGLPQWTSVFRVSLDRTAR
ncbi:hypothetical protein J2W56_006710 [Nocardia kruczakiae]|uniref:Uncharacterized protein n=1 Tax=Nocardia kruczakiae TaxID=261477 RepID=A0ABU1XQY1_9NOCA|nr:hypothetical protein [Nocardia kruczakiae]